MSSDHSGRPELPTIITSLPTSDPSHPDHQSSSTMSDPSFTASTNPAQDPFTTPSPSVSGSPTRTTVPSVAVQDAAGRLVVPQSPDHPATTGPSDDHSSNIPASPAHSATSSEAPLAQNGALAASTGPHKGHRKTASAATMGSVLSEEGPKPIAVDFEADEKAGMMRKGSLGASSGVPKTNSEEDALPSPVGAGKPKPRTLWQKLTFRGKKSGGEEGKKDDEEEVEEDPMAAARAASRLVSALPDPPPEEMAPFDLSPRRLNSLIDPKSLSVLASMGGAEGLLKSLRTNGKTGLAGPEGDKDWDKRGEVYGENRVPEKSSKSLMLLMWMALKDKVLVLLMIAAVISLALGLYTTFGTPPKTYEDENGNTVQEPQVDWVEGVAILVAVAIVTIVGSLNDYQKERQFRKLNAQKDERNVKVLRNSQEALLNVHDLRVGDVVLLEPGEIIPVDGVLLEGFGVRCDESGATGESDAVKKGTWEEVKHKGEKGDCFLISGAKVLEGYGRYVVIGVGRYSFFGKIMMSLRGDTESTPLQLKLNRLAELIAKIGATAGLVLFSVLMIKFFVQLKQDPGRSSSDVAQAFIQVLIIAVTVVVVAVPEGLPLAVTLALAFATRRMTKMNLLVRVLSSCETMANATVVCTDKTGTLTTNKMTVVAGSVGVHLKFADRITENNTRVNANDDIEGIEADISDETKRDPSIISEKVEPRTGRLDFSMDMSEVGSTLDEPLRKLFNDSIAINTTAFEGTDEHGVVGFVGSKTEVALLAFAQAQGWEDYKPIRERAKVAQMLPFSSERKAMGVVVQLPEGGYRMFLKGASEVLIRSTERYVYVSNPAGDQRPLDSSILVGDEIKTAAFDHETLGNISRTITFYATQSLRTIALCYRDFASWPPEGTSLNENGEVDYKLLSRKLNLLAVVGIEDPLREGVTEAVAACAGAGVAVKMVTGDNVITAKSIATQCGIYTPGGVIMEGPVFRKLSERDMLEVAPRLQVLARSSPEDKKLLVEHLKARGEVVGVTGDGTNDGPALKTANVGFSMGIAGTEVAKEASDIILMDDNFASIVSAIMWGRCVNDSVKKFLQFQISVNITAVIVTFITATASDTESSVLTAVQLLWVNLIMDTFAALALATDPAHPDSLKRKPDSKTADLISCQMWMMIIGQSIFQLGAVLILNFGGRQILGLGHSVPEDDELKTLVFNTFVFCQIFNQLNARVLGRDLNIFRGFFKNYYFLGIFAIMVGGQCLIVEVGGAAFQVVRIGARDWGISVIVGSLSLPIGVLIRLLPTRVFEQFAYRWNLLQDPEKLPTQSPQADEHEYIAAIEKVRDNLATFGQIRGGRLRSSSFVKGSRSHMMKKKDIHPGALMTMVPTLVMSSIGAGWQPVNGSLSDPAAGNPTRSTTQLVDSRYEVHPDTDSTDPVMQKFGDGTFRVPRSRSASVATHGTGSTHSRQGSLANLSASPRTGGAGGVQTLSVPPSPIR